VLKKILLVLAILIAGFFVAAAMQPNEYTVTRSTTIAAPPADVFALVNDFHKWDTWSPWAKLDPAMKTSFEGAPAGPGSIYKWVGNSDVGEGRMTILDNKPGEMIRIKLEFIKPFESNSTTEFQFKPEGSGTNVNWTMTGENNLISKAFGLVMGGMDKMVGPDFEKGLVQMKAAAERK